MHVLYKFIAKKKFRFNFFFGIFVGIVFAITRIATSAQIESVGGNIFITIILYSLIEGICSIISAELVLKLDPIKAILIGFFSNFIFLCTFYFAPLEFWDFSDNQVIFFTFFLILGKSFTDVISSIVIGYYPKLVSAKRSSTLINFSLLVSRIILIFIPYITYYWKKIFNLHSFFLYGILSLILSILTKFIKINYPDKPKHIQSTDSYISIGENETLNENTKDIEMKEK